MSFTSAQLLAAPRWRDVYLAAAARGVSACGDYLAATALALTLVARGDNGYGVAALLLAEALPLVLLGSVAGRLADRVDSRVVLVTTGLVQALVCAVLAYAGDPATIVALMAVLSAGAAITQPTVAALVPEMVGTENLPKAMSISQTAGAVGMLAGPALGGLLVGMYGAHLPLLLDAGTFLAIAAAGLALRTRRGGRRVRPPVAAGAPQLTATSIEVSTTSGPPWRLRHDRLLLTLLAALASVVAAVTAVSVVEIFFVRETLGASATTYGVISAVWTLGMLVGAFPFARVGRGDDRRLVTTQLVLLASISAIVLGSAAVPTALWLLPLYLVGGALNAGLNVLAGVVVGRRAPAAVRGRVAGTFAAVANAANVFGYAVGGLLMPLSTPRVLLAGTGAAGLVVATVFLAPLVTGRGRDTGRASGVPVPASEPAAVS